MKNDNKTFLYCLNAIFAILPVKYQVDKPSIGLKTQHFVIRAVHLMQVVQKQTYQGSFLRWQVPAIFMSGRNPQWSVFSSHFLSSILQKYPGRNGWRVIVFAVKRAVTNLNMFLQFDKSHVTFFFVFFCHASVFKCSTSSLAARAGHRRSFLSPLFTFLLTPAFIFSTFSFVRLVNFFVFFFLKCLRQFAIVTWAFFFLFVLFAFPFPFSFRWFSEGGYFLQFFCVFPTHFRSVARSEVFNCKVAKANDKLKQILEVCRAKKRLEKVSYIPLHHLAWNHKRQNKFWAAASHLFTHWFDQTWFYKKIWSSSRKRVEWKKIEEKSWGIQLICCNTWFFMCLCLSC